MGISEFIRESHIQKIIRIISIVPLAAVAGLRDLTIGTDIANYGFVNFYATTQFKNYFEYLSYIKSINGVEIGYSTLNFIVSRFTNSVAWFFFILNFITILFIALALMKNHSKLHFFIGMIVYYLMFWDISLNIMRQSLAIAIVFYAISIYIDENKIKPFIFWVIIAMLFHQTAILALFIPILYQFSERHTKDLSYIVISIGSILLYLFLRPQSNIISVAMESIPFLGKYYTIFLQSGMEYVATGSGMSIRTVLINIFPMLLAIIGFLFIKTDDAVIIKNKRFFINLMILSIAFEFVNINSGVFARLGMYFSVIQVEIYPNMVRLFKRIEIKTLFIIVLIIYLLVVSYHRITAGSGEIYPYTSQILRLFM